MKSRSLTHVNTRAKDLKNNLFLACAHTSNQQKLSSTCISPPATLQVSGKALSKAGVSIKAGYWRSTTAYRASYRRLLRPRRKGPYSLFSGHSRPFYHQEPFMEKVFETPAKVKPFKRLLRTNSSKTTFEENITLFKQRVRDRGGYPDNLSDKTLSEVNFSEKKMLALQNKPKNTQKHFAVC